MIGPVKFVKTAWPGIKTAIRNGCQVVLTVISKGCIKQLALGKEHAAASRALSGPPSALICLIFALFRMCIWERACGSSCAVWQSAATDASNMRAAKMLRATNIQRLMAPFGISWNRCDWRDSVLLQALMATSGCSTSSQVDRSKQGWNQNQREFLRSPCLCHRSGQHH